MVFRNLFLIVETSHNNGILCLNISRSRSLGNINALKTLFDHYACINSKLNSPKFTKSMALYFVAFYCQ